MTRIVLPLLLFAACDERPPAPSAAQNSQLDEAEAMLDADEGNEKGPAVQTADPSSN